MKQSFHLKVRLTILLFLATLTSSARDYESQPSLIPSQQYGNFFYDVMRCDSLFGKDGLFVDSKTFLDIEPKGDLDSILIAYGQLPQPKTYRTLYRFITEYFSIPNENIIVNQKFSNIDEYIKALWSLLQHKPKSIKGGTFLPLDYPYFVPGGRFREIYYWDSYFSMLGMACDGEVQLIENLVNNFAKIIDSFGFIPNGNRSYYLGRSQPPFFAQMVELLAQTRQRDSLYIKYLPEMQKEYTFWMKGAETLSPSNKASLHTVRMADGSVLNRYYDIFDTPRDEMYRNDVETGKSLKASDNSINLGKLFRDLRSAAESGHDFSSRWMSNGKNLYTTHTTDFVPTDLNSLLYKTECILSYAYSIKKDKQQAEFFYQQARKRKKAINKYLWDGERQYYFDYIWNEERRSDVYSLAGTVPLYCHVATKNNAKKASETIMRTFLRAGGLVTTPNHTGEQWDAPNGWAPLQWMAYKGFYDYGYRKYADIIRSRWMHLCESEFNRTGVLFEKYNVEDSHTSHGGEYLNQVGFGWSNGVYQAMKYNWQTK